MNILYLGRANTELSHSYIYALRNISTNLVVLNSHPKLSIESIPNFTNKIFNLYKNRTGFSNKFLDWLLFYPRFKVNSYWSNYDKQTINIIHEIITSYHIDLVFCWWGADVLYELNLIKKANLSPKLIWSLIVYPSSVSWYSRFFEKLLTKVIIHKVQGLVYGSDRQKRYVEITFHVENIKNVVFTQTISKDDFHKEQLPKLSERNLKFNIVFLGRSDFSKDPRRIKDDIRFILEALDHIEIITYIAKTDSKIKAKNIQFCDTAADHPIARGEFANYLTQFDACLVAYNYKDTKYHERFDTGIPARMVSAISAGLPIIIPEGTMKACADFVCKHEIGFTYKNVDDLLSLIKSDRFQTIKKNALQNAIKFSFEDEFNKINTLISTVIRES